MTSEQLFTPADISITLPDPSGGGSPQTAPPRRYTLNIEVPVDDEIDSDYIDVDLTIDLDHFGLPRLGQSICLDSKPRVDLVVTAIKDWYTPHPPYHSPTVTAELTNPEQAASLLRNPQQLVAWLTQFPMLCPADYIHSQANAAETHSATGETDATTHSG